MLLYSILQTQDENKRKAEHYYESRLIEKKYDKILSQYLFNFESF